MGEEITTFEQAIDLVLTEMRDTMVRKQKDYGPGNIADMGELGLVVRVNDKMARLKNLTLGKEEAKLEHIQNMIEEYDGDLDDPTLLIGKIMSVASSEEAPQNESIDDTWLDLANYGLIAQMVRRGLWGLPLEGE